MTNPAATAPADLLETIIAATRCAVAERGARRPLRDVERAAAARQPRGDRFVAALADPDRYSVIAECKRRSPSRGVIRADYEPATIAAGYAAAGAAALSVLPEPAFFDGALDHLRAVRGCVDIPLLQKDFIVSEYQLIEGRAAGADAALLIAAGIDDAMLRRLSAEASALGLAVLAEVHDRIELDRVLAAGAAVVGVNNRNLRTLAVDLEASRTLVEAVPEGTVAVAESGLRTPADLQQLRGAGYDAFLMGESLMSQPEPGAALARLLAGVESVPRGARERPLRPETQTR
ncbi:MAG: indole-3-glycerol phosphate synthase TrpC [Acidobacteria bacterium]|nr:indole-3-glycerol phosphate synthase TrpC [Acidobacteriota bacterium]